MSGVPPQQPAPLDGAAGATPATRSGLVDEDADPLVHPVARQARHRARTNRVPAGLRPGLLWPVGALLVVGLVSARLLRGTPLPDDGTLTAPAFALLRSDVGSGLPALSPDGLGALLTAVYATLTRAFDRHDTLVAAGRELLLVTLLVSGLLLWRAARRVGLSDPSSAVALLALGAVPWLTPVHLASTPGALAVPWLLLSSWLLAGGRPAPASGVLAGAAALVATLLAPDVLLLGTAGAAAALATGAVLPRWNASRRLAAALALAPLFVGVTLLLGRWDPQPASPARWGASTGGLLAVTVVLVLIGAVGAVFLPRLRPAGIALVLTAATTVAPAPGRLSALQVCLPVAALLLGALAQITVRRALPTTSAGAGRPERLSARLRPAQLAAAAALVAAAAAAVLTLGRAPTSDFGAAAHRAALAWQDQQLAPDAALVGSSSIWSELVHAGGDPTRVRLTGAAAPGNTTTGQVLQVRGTDADRAAPPHAVATFASGGAAVQVIDPERGEPTAAARELRAELSGALLTNPTSADDGQATGALNSGDVDPRLLTLLAGLQGQFSVGLRTLPTVPGEQDTGTLVRVAVLDSIDGVPLTDDPALVDRLRAWLTAQRAPFLPDRITRTPEGMQLSFHYVSDADALVAEATA